MRASEALDELEGRALRAIRECLERVLGEGVAEALYRHFEERAGPRKGLEPFIAFLRELFDEGYGALEKMVLEAVREGLGVEASSLSELASLIERARSPCPE